MCANYTPVTRLERLKAYFAAGHPAPFPDETFPGLPAPFVRRAREGGSRELATGLFGLLPHWAKDASAARRTYNARSETADAKPSFRDAWQRGRRCVVACESIFEPRYGGARPVRWRIERADGAPIGVAGLWSRWHAPDGRVLDSFAMLTVNADAHALLREFHKPGSEKRMVAMLDPAEYDDWLHAAPERMRDFLRCYPAESLRAEPAPMPAVEKAAPAARRADDKLKDAAKEKAGAGATLPLFPGGS